MFKMAVGYSDDVDDRDAIDAALDQATAGLGESSPTAGVLFAGIDYDHGSLVAAVIERYPDISLIGCVADGQMSSESGYADDGVTITLFASDVVDMTAGLGENVSADPVAATMEAVRQARAGSDKAPALAIVFTDLLQTDLGAVVKALGAALGAGVPVVGGASAAEDLRARPWTSHQFYKDRVVSDGLPVLLFSGPLKHSTAIAHGWNPIGKAATVTSSERNRVDALGGETVVEYYRTYLGDASGSLMANPLAVYDPDGSFVLRAVTESTDDGAASYFMGEVPQGCTVQVSMTPVPEILAAAMLTSAEARATYPGPDGPAGAFLVSCAVRKMLLGSQATREAAGIQGELGAGLPMAGFYAWAEIGPLADGVTRLHNATFVTLLLGT